MPCVWDCSGGCSEWHVLGGYAVLQGMICRQQQEVYGWQIRTPAAGSSRRSTGGTSGTLQQVDFAGPKL